MELIILDGARFTDREAAHAYLAKTMRFPNYYGGNLDALADCLGELGQGVFIILVNPQALTEALGDYGRKMIALFEELSAEPGAFEFRLN